MKLVCCMDYLVDYSVKCVTVELSFIHIVPFHNKKPSQGTLQTVTQQLQLLKHSATVGRKNILTLILKWLFEAKYSVYFSVASVSHSN